LINPQLFTPDDSVTAALDSMGLMQFIMLMAQKFRITLGPEDLNRDDFATLGDRRDFTCLIHPGVSAFR
jgi:acyl carrier protein